MTAPVYLADLTGAAVGRVLTLDGAEAHHAYVMRMRPGSQVDVVDGAGLRACGEVQQSTVDQLRVEVHQLRNERCGTRLVLVQALAKSGRDELAVETATEVGVDLVIPWQAQRSIVRWQGTKATKGPQKWQDTALAAMKQSRRSVLPQVEQPVDSRQLADNIAQATAAGAVVFVLHEEAAGQLPAVFDAVAQIWVVVGPEGGITADELEMFCSAGAQTAQVGPYVLRASTAGPVALSHLARAVGRWDHT